jgi:hypothetical protein
MDEISPRHAAALQEIFMKPFRPFAFFFGKFFFEAETTLYIALSVADLIMTNFLLQQEGNVEFVEANPVAREIINSWGPRGMVYFKLGMVGFVCLVTQIIAHYRPLTARLVLFFAIAMMLYVVVYSVRLYVSHAAA